MPNLENLKKQAKQILRWHRDGYYPVAAMIRDHLPAFAGLSDPEVMSRELKLVDAQELVARRLGFASWESLKGGIESMSTHSRSAVERPTLLAAEPQLFVSDVPASCRYFQERLGFSVAFAYGEPPFYAQVFRDGARLNLRCVEGAALDAERRAREDLLSASIVVDDVKALFLEFQLAGAECHQALRKEPWGARTFIVCDPDGNLILFAGGS